MTKPMKVDFLSVPDLVILRYELAKFPEDKVHLEAVEQELSKRWKEQCNQQKELKCQSESMNEKK